jgi:hydrogenase nickel incorporation protein HypB
MTPRIVEIREGILKKNDAIAAGLRDRFRSSGTLVVNLAASPGAGKTQLLEATLTRLLERGHRAAAIVGDPETENDAVRLARSGAPVRQIRTHGLCHLNAPMIEQHLEGWDLNGFEFLFIENVGNLVCTTNHDLGESLRVVLLSTTEGEDKPLKYPGLFNSADAFIISKIDLAAACEFDREAAAANLRAVRPEVPIFETSGKTGAGLDHWLEFLLTWR